MIVKRFQAKNFQILKDTTLEDLKAFNVFIGPNATGKSTVLQALDVLLEGGSIGLSSDVPFRGSSDDPVELKADVDFSPQDIDWIVDDASGRQNRTPPPESVRADLRRALAIKVTFGYAALAPKLPEMGATSYGKHALDGTNQLGGLIRTALQPEAQRWINEQPPLHGLLELGFMRLAAERTIYLPTTRSTQHSFGIGRPSKPSPGTIGQYLHVARGEKGPQFDGYEKALSQMLPHAKGIIFRPDTGSAMRWGISEEGLPGMSPAEFWSSGTRHLSMFLGFLTTAPLGTIALVEEPELSLHPSAISKLIREMHTLADSGRIQFFLTTHSPVVTYGLDPATKSHALWQFQREADGSASANRCETESQIEEAINSLLRP